MQQLQIICKSFSLKRSLLSSFFHLFQLHRQNYKRRRCRHSFHPIFAMNKTGIKFLYICAVLLVSLNGLRGSKDFYRAAVFEIFQFYNSSSEWEIIEKNLEKYAIAAKVASSELIDILVYPEKGLFPHLNGSNEWAIPFAENVPDPTIERVNPCDQFDDSTNSSILKNISCLSKEHQIYIVADLIDVKKCEVESTCNEYNVNYCRESEKDCPEGGEFHFNTLVAFDRNGTLVARYYKRHVYFTEIGIDTPKYQKSVYFDTDFGKFTGVICFDLLFDGAVRGVQGSDVSALTYPTWWYDTAPMIYFSTPYQQAWSLTNRVDVLAANVQYPREGSLGSGIYSASRGALIYTENPDARSKLLISNVPKSASLIPNDTSLDTKFYYIDDGNVVELQGEEPRDFKSECGTNVLGEVSSDSTDYRCDLEDLKQYTYVKLNETYGNFKICSNEFCCRLNYEAESMNETFYFGVSSTYLNLYDVDYLRFQACFLARCEPVDGEPCRNLLLKSNTIFRTVEITGFFNTTYIYPFAINSDIRLTDKDEWNFDGESQILYQNIRRQPLLFIGLDGRLYSEDKIK